MNDITIIDNEESMPGIYLYQDSNNNVYLSSPNAPYDLPFKQTRESLLDVETYKTFISKSISAFRSTKEYKHYKSYLMSLGLDHCQIFGYLSEEELGKNGLQMHHNFLTIWDIAVLITEHVVNTTGMITSFLLVDLLIQEHADNDIPIVMLSETPHELYHSESDQFLPPDMTFGRWWLLLYKYRFGITIEIAKKVIAFCQQYLDDKNYRMSIQLKQDMQNFAVYNQYASNNLTLYGDADTVYNFNPSEYDY